MRYKFKSQSPSKRCLEGSLASLVRDWRVDGSAVLFEVAMDLYESIGTPVALSCAILLRYREIPELVRKTIDPGSYNDLFEFEKDYQSVSFLRKVPFNSEGLDPIAEAKRKFLLAEAKCKETNSRFRHFVTAPERASGVVRKAFCIAHEKIHYVLGNKVSYTEWIRSCRFGPGAFTHPDCRGLTSVYDKLQVQPSVSHDFLGAGAILVMSSPSWARSILDIEDEGFWPFVKTSDLRPVPGNRVAFVPKTAVTDRAIAIEPLVNVYAQLGLGSMIRKRLSAFADIDLNDQSVNQQLAREGSNHGFLSTVDLSSASDTIATEVVRSLVPDEWFHALDSCRSKIGEHDGEFFRYEKFSSMGNGFTFELETLVFWALAQAACEISNAPTLVSVYGDDIIVPVEATDALFEILKFFGFDLNLQKTFVSGLFRESCGKDYYDGIDVRPFLQKEVPNDLPGLICLANGIRRRARRSYRSSFLGCDRMYRRAYQRVLRSIPQSVVKHLLVPAHAGDVEGLITDWDQSQTSALISRKKGWDGWFGIRIAPKPLLSPRCANFEGGVASLLYRARDGFGSDYSPANPRQGRDVSFELRGGAFWGPWTDLGDWF